MTTIPDDPHVSAALGELRDLPGEPDWHAMEDRLTEAFAHRSASAPQRSSSHAWWHWMAAAAVVFLAAAITFSVPSSRYGLAVPKTDPPRPVSQPGPPPDEPSRVTAPAPPVTPRLAPGVKPLPARPAVRPAQPATPASSEFVALPAAFALPELESGRIVRMEVPLAMLPAYGLEFVPDATPSAVQAEFLIGQDGVPRAIRLASNSQ